MDGPGLDADNLTHALGRPAGGRGQQHRLPHGLQQGDDHPGGGGLAAARSTGEDRTAPVDHGADGLGLLRAQGHALAGSVAVHPVGCPGRVDAAPPDHSGQPPGHVLLLVIDRFAVVAGCKLAGGVGQQPQPQLALLLHDLQVGRNGLGQAQAEQFLHLGDDLGDDQVTVALFARGGEHMADRGPYPQFRIRGKTQRQRHPVGGEKTDAVKILGQTIGVVLDDGDRLVAVLLIDTHRVQGRDAVLLKKEHDVAYGPVLAPGLADAGQFLASNAGHLGQLVDILFEHLQSAVAEMADNAAGDLRPHAADQPGTKIFFQGAGAGRFEFGRESGLELAAESGVLRPVAGELHGGPGKDPHLVHRDRGRIAQQAKERDLEHRPAAGFVVVGDPFDNASNFFLNFRLFHV